MSEEQKDIRLVHGDALKEIAKLPPGSVDCVLTDPPYGSGGISVCARRATPKNKYAANRTDLPEFEGESMDQRVYAAWAERWMRAARRATKPGGWLYVFSDWRQYPLMSDCLQLGGWLWQGVIVWDKKNARAALGKHRQQCEFVLMATNGKGDTGINSTVRVCPPNIWQGMMDYKERLHMTEKPIGLLKHILTLQRPGDLVLDPFAGSGSTLVAARELGLRAIGVEITEHYYNIARKRLDQ